MRVGGWVAKCLPRLGIIDPVLAIRFDIIPLHNQLQAGLMVNRQVDSSRFAVETRSS